MELTLLKEIVIILGLSVFIILAMQKLRVPSVIGLLITGIIAGPNGLGLISAYHEVEMLSEIGVVFLLFVIGLEFSLKGLISIRRTVLGGGALQVGGTILATLGLGAWMGMAWKEALFIGFLLSLSSTAIVLKIIQESGDIASPQGRITLAVLIFQDIVVVPMMLFTPVMAGEGGDLTTTVIWLSLKVILVIGVVILSARYLAPIILAQVVKTKNKELFILTIVVLCFATAWLTSSIGLSLALGAFFSGLVISESDYSHQATASILPFREIFISFFFISVGMLLDLGFLWQNLGWIIVLCLGVILLKTIIVAGSVLALGYPLRTAFLTAFSLFQVGEFAFVLSNTGMTYKLLSPDNYQYFLAISILSMAATPFVMQQAPTLTDYFIHKLLPRRVRKRLENWRKANSSAKEEAHDLHNHLVIIGYGLNGENLAKAAKQAGIPHVIVELDPVVFQKAKANREPVVFGDAADSSILQHVAIQKARVAVIAISDPESTKKIVRQIRSFTKTTQIIVRTRYIREIDENLKLGADEVIPEEFETSIQIFSQVLKKYMVPLDEIQSFVQMVRGGNYDLLRSLAPSGAKPGRPHLHIPDMEISTLYVQQGLNRIVGKSLQDSGLRSTYGVTLLAIQREGKTLTHIGPETVIEQDDLLFLYGSPENMMRLNGFLDMEG